MQPNLSHLYEATPNWLDASFVLITLVTLRMLYAAIRSVKTGIASWFLMISSIWLVVLGALAYNRVFLHLDARPPAFVFVIGPPLLAVTSLFTSTRGRSFIDRLPLSKLVFLHTIRILVEVVLYALYLYQQVPQLMTFEGRNYDILAGLSAPVVTYLTFQRGWLSNRSLLIWNVLGLCLLLNIVVQAILSAPLPVQQLAFEQPNVAILKAPYVWLPGFIVPVVLFSHLVLIYRLTNSR